MAGTYTGILIHVIFSTKLRYPLLHDDWRDELFGYIGGVVAEHKGLLLRAGGIEDHVHLLIKIHPAFAISDTLRLIKSNSSRWITDQRKLGHRFEWQRGYGAFSVSQSMADKVKAYIERQREHHRTQTFRDARLFLGLTSQACTCRRFAAQERLSRLVLGLTSQACTCRRFAAQEPLRRLPPLRYGRSELTWRSAGPGSSGP